MIGIVDYGLGNIHAFQTVYRRLNIESATVRTPAALKAATKIILPGVGHFDYAMQALDESGLRETLEVLVLEKRLPILGVCVGLQMLGHSSEEGTRLGLGWVDGRVLRFTPQRTDLELPVPHMGWNDVQPLTSDPLFRGLERGAKFYFLHSFYFECRTPTDVLATAYYGNEFCASVRSENIYGVQFHPEKSHHFGTTLLKNFAEC